MGRIAGRFARVEPRRRVRKLVLGLLSDLPRKNCWTIAEWAGEATPDGMQHLLGRAKWDADAVRDDVRGYVVDNLYDDQALLVVDETGDVKKGTGTVDVQRQYTGTAGRIENAQVAVYLVYAGRRGHAAVDRELYVPRSWTSDPARCLAAGLGKETSFATNRSWPRAWSPGSWTPATRPPGSRATRSTGAIPRCEPRCTRRTLDDARWITTRSRRCSTRPTPALPRLPRGRSAHDPSRSAPVRKGGPEPGSCCHGGGHGLSIVGGGMGRNLRWAVAGLTTAAAFAVPVWLCGAIVLPPLLKDPAIRWSLASALGAVLGSLAVLWGHAFATRAPAGGTAGRTVQASGERAVAVGGDSQALISTGDGRPPAPAPPAAPGRVAPPAVPPAADTVGASGPRSIAIGGNSSGTLSTGDQGDGTRR